MCSVYNIQKCGKKLLIYNLKHSFKGYRIFFFFLILINCFQWMLWFFDIKWNIQYHWKNQHWAVNWNLNVIEPGKGLKIKAHIFLAIKSIYVANRPLSVNKIETAMILFC